MSKPGVLKLFEEQEDQAPQRLSADEYLRAMGVQPEPDVSQYLPERLVLPGGIETPIKLPKWASAALVGAGYVMSEAPRALEQLRSEITRQPLPPEHREEERLMQSLMAHPEVGGPATAGVIAGGLLEPVGAAAGLATPLPKVRTLWNLAKLGGITGAAVGGLQYVPEGGSRLSNIALGALSGGILTPVGTKAVEGVLRATGRGPGRFGTVTREEIEALGLGPEGPPTPTPEPPLTTPEPPPSQQPAPQATQATQATQAPQIPTLADLMARLDQIRPSQQPPAVLEGPALPKGQPLTPETQRALQTPPFLGGAEERIIPQKKGTPPDIETLAGVPREPILPGGPEQAEAISRETQGLLPQSGGGGVAGILRGSLPMSEAASSSEIFQPSQEAVTKSVMTQRPLIQPSPMSPSPGTWVTLTTIPSQRKYSVGKINGSTPERPDPEAILSPPFKETPEGFTTKETLAQLAGKVKPKQRLTTVEELVAQATQDKEPLTQVLTEIAQPIGGMVDVRIKKLERIHEKIIQRRKAGEPDFGPEHIRDYLGSRLIVDDPLEHQNNVIEALNQRGYRVIEVKDMIDRPNEWGYRAIHLDIETPSGHIAELQLHFPEGAALTGPSHKVYEKWRTVLAEHGKIPDDQKLDYYYDRNGVQRQWIDAELSYLQRAMGRRRAKEQLGQAGPEALQTRPQTGPEIEPQVRPQTGPLIEPQMGPSPGGLRRVLGAPTEIRTATEPIGARYAVVEADDIIPSHNPLRGFSKRPDYPENLQERPYHSDKSEQLKVLRHAANYDPAFTVSDNPDAINGPPVMTSEGIVLGGNSRAMTLQYLYETNPEGARNYIAELKRKAPLFGLDPAQIDRMERPVLVRVVDKQADFPEMQRLVRVFNEPLMQSLSLSAEGVSRARMVSSRTMDVVARAMADERFNSLREFLASPASRDLIDSLIEDGIIPVQQFNKYVSSALGLLNEDGKRLVEMVLRGRVIPDYDLLEALQQVAPSVLQKLDKSLASLSRVVAQGGPWDKTGKLRDAMELYLKFKVAGVFKDIDEFTRQSTLFPDPKWKDPEIIGLARIIAKDSPNKFKARWDAYAETAQMNPVGQKAFGFRPVETPEEALARIFEFGDGAKRGKIRGAEKTPPVEEGHVREASPVLYRQGEEGYSGAIPVAPYTGWASDAPGLLEGGQGARQLSLGFGHPSSAPREQAELRPKRHWGVISGGSKVKHVQVSELKTQFDKITNPEQAAAALASLADRAQEEVLTLVLDSNFRPIAAYRHSLGGISSASFYEGTNIFGAVQRTPGARYVYIAHNHPTGKSGPSDVDQEGTKIIANMFRGSGINFLGHVIIGAKEASFISPKGTISKFYDISPGGERAIPLYERRIAERGLIGEPYGPDDVRNLFSLQLLSRGRGNQSAKPLSCPLVMPCGCSFCSFEEVSKSPPEQRRGSIREAPQRSETPGSNPSIFEQVFTSYCPQNSSIWIVHLPNSREELTIRLLFSFLIAT